MKRRALKRHLTPSSYGIGYDQSKNLDQIMKAYISSFSFSLIAAC